MIRHEIRRMDLLVQRLAAALRDSRRPLPARKLQSAQDVIDLLEEQVELLRAATGPDAVSKARALAYLAELARKAIETGGLTARVEALETARGPNPRSTR